MNIEEIQIGQRVRWLGAKPGTWADNGEEPTGKGTVIDGQGDRVGFDGGVPARQTKEGWVPPRGPAYLVELDGPKKHHVWVAPDDLMQLLEMPVVQ